MADKTAIEWTDATWNPITGCSVVSPGCTNCYAMKLAGTRLKKHPTRQGLTRDTKAGPVWTGEVRFNETQLLEPLHWTRPRKIFVCAHGDLFHESVPNAWIDRVWAIMALTPHHTYQVLTKRSARLRQYLTDPATVRRIINEAFRLDCETGAWMSADHQIAGDPILPLGNVWLGVSAEDQARADERIPDLLSTPAAVRFLSAEPLLGPIDLYNGDPDPRLGGLIATETFIGDWWEPGDDPKGPSRHGLDWVIVGGESGPGARPMHPDWIRSLRGQCEVADVDFHFKQHGAWIAIDQIPDGAADGLYNAPPRGDPEASRRCKVETLVLHRDGSRHTQGAPMAYRAHAGGMLMFKVGKKAAGRLLDGRTHDDFPTVQP
jgi:protein gp37